MIIVLKKNAEKKDVERFTGEIKSRGFGIHLSEGTDKTIIGLLGDTSKLDPEDFLANEIVESAERVSAPYKMASRSFHPANTVVTVGGGQVRQIPLLLQQVIVDDLRAAQEGTHLENGIAGIGRQHHVAGVANRSSLRYSAGTV